MEGATKEGETVGANECCQIKVMVSWVCTDVKMQQMLRFNYGQLTIGQLNPHISC